MLRVDRQVVIGGRHAEHVSGDLKDRSCVDVSPLDCIPDECIDCGACEPECPVEAILPQDALPARREPAGMDVARGFLHPFAASVTVGVTCGPGCLSASRYWPSMSESVLTATFIRAHINAFPRLISVSGLRNELRNTNRRYCRIPERLWPYCEFRKLGWKCLFWKEQMR